MGLLLDHLLGLLRSEVFVINSERFLNKDHTVLLERGVGKHPLLKPEPIVVNDQLTGFKKIKKKLEALEEFPIFYDIEGYWEEDKWYINYIDLYIEADVSIQKYLSEAIYLSKLFQEVLVLDRVFNTSSESEESIRITSLINHALEVDYVDDDDDDESIFVSLDFAPVSVLKTYVEGLLDFSYVLYGLVQEKKSLKVLEAWLHEQSQKRS